MINQKHLFYFFVVTTSKNRTINFKFENVSFTKLHKNRLMILLMLLIKLSFIKNDKNVKVYNSVAKLDSTRTRLNTVRQTTSKT